MSTRKPTVIVTRRLPDVVETRMRELFSTTLNETDAPMSQSDLSILSVTVGTRTSAVLAASSAKSYEWMNGAS